MRLLPGVGGAFGAPKPPPKPPPPPLFFGAFFFEAPPPFFLVAPFISELARGVRRGVYGEGTFGVASLSLRPPGISYTLESFKMSSTLYMMYARI